MAQILKKLLSAIATTKFDIARDIIRQNPRFDVNTVTNDDEYQTALHMTVKNGNVDFAKFLIDHGADVNLQDGDGFAPIHLAVIYRKPDIVKLLIERGADINATINGLYLGGYTPLKLAIYYENKKIENILNEFITHQGQGGRRKGLFHKTKKQKRTKRAMRSKRKQTRSHRLRRK